MILSVLTSLFSSQLLIYYVIIVAFGVLGWFGKQIWGRAVRVYEAAMELSNPKTGIHADIKSLRERLDTTSLAHAKAIDHVTRQIEDLRKNGHAFADRVANVEDRVQQGSVELDQVRRQVTKIDHQLGGR